MNSSPPVKVRKKLIEVALPLAAINKAASREKSIRHGNPSTLHLWWSRKPTAAARAVIFAQMVDDPSASPDLFPTEKAQEKERKRLFKIIEDLVQWENTTNQDVLQRAREEIWQSWRRTCADNADHPRAKELFDRHKLPVFYDPFVGGGSLPLEAQRLGLESYASDLNPVAVLISKATVEIPPRFSGRPPVNPDSRRKFGAGSGSWKRARGLIDDVSYYGDWVRNTAFARIGQLYPCIQITPEMAKDREDLKSLIGKKLTVIAWLWARTVKSPNPAFAKADIPLASSFLLSTRKGKEVYVEPVITRSDYEFAVRVGKPPDFEITKNGTRLARGSFRCLLSGVPVSYQYVDAEANAGRMGQRLMAVVADSEQGRVYLPPNRDMEQVALTARPSWKPETPSRGTWASNAQGRRYGFHVFGDYFTLRQLVALTTFSDLVQEARSEVYRAAIAAGMNDDGRALHDGGTGAPAYADAIAVYLALAVDRTANTVCTIARWTSDREQTVTAFAQQGIAMTWGYPEVNPFAGAAGDYSVSVKGVVNGIPDSDGPGGIVFQANALTQERRSDAVVSTDPPYYDNVGYADLSEFFYVWLRRSLKPVFPELFATLIVPKSEELIATVYRHGSKQEAEAFFIKGMTEAMTRIAHSGHPAFPMTVYYAFKQSEGDGAEGTASTGWQTFLEGLLRARFAVTGTLPIRTELINRKATMNTNALASSIVLVCRAQSADTREATRREFVDALKARLPAALMDLQASNIAPVDLAQAAIGPGMAVFTQYSKVLDARDRPLSVREALALINETLDTALAEQEGDFDADTRFALTWFEQYGFSENEFGEADKLARAKNTSVDGTVDAGIVRSKAGKVRLLKPNELDADWDPVTDSRLTNWEIVHHLIRALELEGESAAAEIVTKLGSGAETARELCYRLYTLCERKKRAAEALSYNALVQSWPEIMRLAREKAAAVPVQQELV